MVLKLSCFLYTRNFLVPQGDEESKEQKQHYPLVAAKQYGNAEKFKGEQTRCFFHIYCMYRELRAARKAFKTE